MEESYTTTTAKHISPFYSICTVLECVDVVIGIKLGQDNVFVVFCQKKKSIYL